jgi:hypothetical protein
MIREQTATAIQAAGRGMMRRAEVRKQLPALERARKKTVEKNRKALNRGRKIQEKLQKKEEMNRLKQEKLERKMKSNKLNQKENSDIQECAFMKDAKQGKRKKRFFMSRLIFHKE